jgi:hypothetical protein
MSDVLLYLVRMSHLCRIDLAAGVIAVVDAADEADEGEKKRKRVA